jgi:small subunit ribosomal protein S11
MAKKSKKIVAKKRVRRNISSGVVHIQSTFNNTIVTISDENGNTIAWSSSGVQKFKGSRKSTPFAAKLVAEDAGQKAMEQGLKNISIFIKGPGPGRESALRALHALGFNISMIKDVTTVPHNGCRPPKRRRV